MSLTCRVKNASGYEATLHIRPRIQADQREEKAEAQEGAVNEQEHHWEGIWGEERTVVLGHGY